MTAIIVPRPQSLDRDFYPENISGLIFWDPASSATTAATSYAGTGTVSVSGTAATFSTSQTGLIATGDTFTAGGNTYTVGAGATTSWTVSAGGNITTQSFTVTRQFPRVTALNSLGVTGYQFSSATASQQPLYVAAAANGRPVLRYDGAIKGLSGNAALLALHNNIAATTLIAVRKCATLTGTQIIISCSNSTGVSRFSADISGSKARGNARGNGGSTVTTPDPSNASTTAFQIHTVGISYTAGTIALAINNATVASSSAISPTGNAEAANSQRLRLGADTSGTPASVFNGDLAWAGIAARLLTAAELNYISRGLAARFGISSA